MLEIGFAVTLSPQGRGAFSNNTSTRMKKFLSLLPELIAISISGGLGVLLSHTIVTAFGLEGAWTAAVMILLSLFLTFAFFVLGIAILNAVRQGKPEKR
jgi:hypothetical protein